MTKSVAVTKRLPAVEGVWVFVGADMFFFAVLFFSFITDRAKQVELFESSAAVLNADIGGINTLILLASSWFVVQAVHAAKQDRLSEIPKWLIAAFACGIAFWVSKVIEYSDKFSAGITPVTNDFYMYYYTLTGLHLLHVTGGCVLLVYLWLRARKGAFNSQRLTVLEGGGIYWHMVDLLWIVLFPLLYLMR
jgi:nitric oxide reductase NorE protein